ncbi:tyrosine phosphatase family-domain-containing protein [Gorgonomyces haynaldii]|nr:tyrosine phosphatase family-domain-containing protein [Gorgonomyces haynaldii]
MHPPFRFGIVESKIYRGGYPKPKHLKFLKTLGLKTIISFVPEPLDLDLDCKMIHIRTDKPKENIPIDYKRIDDFLQLMLTDVTPVYIHCLDGQLVTTLVISCLRKLQCWSVFSYLQEANRYVELQSEEIDWIKRYPGEFDLPSAVPGWIWDEKPKRHPSLRLKKLASPEMVAEEVVQDTRMLEALDLDLGHY